MLIVYSYAFWPLKKLNNWNRLFQRPCAVKGFMSLCASELNCIWLSHRKTFSFFSFACWCSVIQLNSCSASSLQPFFPIIPHYICTTLFSWPLCCLSSSSSCFATGVRPPPVCVRVLSWSCPDRAVLGLPGLHWCSLYSCTVCRLSPSLCVSEEFSWGYVGIMCPSSQGSSCKLSAC